ncbi:hypothetical protein OIU78_009352 [Salix suchowensis]|nr:hypothetical protein OIU78_009352 [Salix suchowensis]
MARPNCAETCGNISIPFPFGIGTGCYMNSWFAVDCNKTTADSPGRAFLSSINMEVLEISLEGSLVRVNSPVISSGCSGRGYPNDQGTNQCKVAFIVEREWSLDNIKSPEAVQHLQHVPAILNWFVYNDDIPEGEENSDAMKCSPPLRLISSRWGLSTVTLYSNSITCSCNPGYNGNPYLLDGCTDIDQCKIPKENWCPGMTRCVNVPGMYKCELDKAKITFLSKFLSLLTLLYCIIRSLKH